MSTILARIKEGNFKIKEECNERLPAITNGLVAHYPFDGFIDKCLDVSEVTSYIDTSYPISTTPNTFECRIMIPTTIPDATRVGCIIGNYPDAFNVQLEIYTNGMPRLWWNGIISWIVNGVDLRTGKEEHICFVRDDAQGKIFFYLNGALNATLISTVPDLIPSGVFRIAGDKRAKPGLPFYGEYIRELRVWSNSRTLTEINNTLYSSLSGEEIGLLGYWKGNEGTGSILNDYSKNRNNGTIYNATWKDRNISVNTNNTLTYDGIAVEEATTNLVLNPTLTSLNGYSSRSTSTYNISLDSINSYNSHNSLKIIASKIGYAGADVWITSTIVPTINSSYIFSFYAKSADDTVLTARWGYGATTNTALITKQWKRYSIIITEGSSSFQGVLLMFDKVTTLWINSPQIEDKTFATSFVDGSRGAGSLQIPLNLGLSNFTVISKFIPNSNSDALPNGAKFMSFGAGFQLATYLSGTKGLPYINTMSMGAGSNVHFDFNTLPQSECINIIKRDGTAFTWRIISDDGQDATWTFVSEFVASYDFMSVTFYSTWGGIHKDLSIYNKVLSNDEILKLVNNKLSIRSAGSIIGSEIIESSINIPSDVYYFPLTLDDKDTTNSCSASTSSNIVFGKNGAWVGTSVNNLVSNSNGKLNATVEGSYTPGWDTLLHPKAFLVTGWSSGYNGGVPSPEIGYHAQWVNEGIDGNEPCMKFIDKNDKYSLGHRWLGISQTIGILSSVAAGDSITMKWSQKSDVLGRGASPGIYHKLISTGGYSFGSSCVGHGSTKVNEWEEMSYTFTINSDWDLTLSATLYVYGTYGDYGTTWVDNFQIEIKKPFASEYAVTTRGAGLLTYNFNRDIGLDWSGDWTICYWKKPMGTSNDTMTGYSIDSLGCMGNSVGGGYLSLGKSTSYDWLQIYTSSRLYTPFVSYFNKWHMVSLSKSGTTITAKFWGIDGGVKVLTYNGGVIKSNYYVTQYGYDFKLGGWDNTNPSNSYYRDLIVAKRALTDDELLSIYKTQMRNTNNGKLLLQNGLIENGLL